MKVEVSSALDAEELLELSRFVRRVPIADHVARLALRLARMSRPQHDDAHDFVRQYVQWGAGPRASQHLVLGAKARAVLQGRMMVGWEDIRAIALPVLRHRIKTNFNADADGVTHDDRPAVDRRGRKGTSGPATWRNPVSFRSADAG